MVALSIDALALVDASLVLRAVVVPQPVSPGSSSPSSTGDSSLAAAPAKRIIYQAHKSQSVQPFHRPFISLVTKTLMRYPGIRVSEKRYIYLMTRQSASRGKSTAGPCLLFLPLLSRALARSAVYLSCRLGWVYIVKRLRLYRWQCALKINVI